MPAIAAIATPQGAGGVGIVRVSGPGALDILAAAVRPCAEGFSGFKPRLLHHCWLVDSLGQPLDECLAVAMPGPGSFTGEDLAEIHCHGSPLLVQWALDRCLELGARQAGPGEFTRRAFLNGRLDLSQAEAVAELVAAPCAEAARNSLERLQGHLGAKVRALQEALDDLAAQACVALDFPDDEIPPLPREELAERAEAAADAMSALASGARRAAIHQNGCRILLLGPVNAGKSSLLNAFAGRERALVSPLPGTTRDFIEADLDFGGLPVRLLDSAGLRGEAADPVEALGMARSLELIGEADLIWLVLDQAAGGEGLAPLLAQLGERRPGAPAIAVLNKSDLAPGAAPPSLPEPIPAIAVSALAGEGLDKLARLSREMILGAAKGDGRGLAPNARQARLLELARQDLLRLAEDLRAGQSQDAALCSLDSARERLGEILGLAPHDGLLDKIFSQFCIGK